MKATTVDNIQVFYQDCLDYIDEIFKKGADNLTQILGIFILFCVKFSFNKSLDDEYFPQYVVMPVDYWFHVCDRFGHDIEMYSNDFLQSFEKSDFFSTCKKEVEGKLSWNDWGTCSASCGGGARIKIAHSCVPEYAVCNDIPIIEEPCNSSICPDMPSTYLPPGTIISWVPKPNLDAPDSVYFDDDTWIRCDGTETCKQGRFVGQYCSDLSDR